MDHARYLSEALLKSSVRLRFKIISCLTKYPRSFVLLTSGVSMYKACGLIRLDLSSDANTSARGNRVSGRNRHSATRSAANKIVT